MNIIKHANGVYEFKNFISQELQSILLSEAKKDVGWDSTHKGNTLKKMSDESFLKMEKIYKSIEELFINIDLLETSFNLRRLQYEEYMWPHKDDAGPDNPRKIVFGIAIYLNDDFEGGELIYPDLGISLTPSRGSMVIHDAELKHQVFPVTKNKRYSITTFVFGDDTTKINPELLINAFDRNMV